MKNINSQKSIRNALLALFISVAIVGCERKFEPTPHPYDTSNPPPAPPIIPVMNEVTPLKALAGSVITIKGYNFNTTLSANTATIAGVPAVVNSVSISEVLLTVPATLPAGTAGKVVLVSGGTTLTSVNNFVVTGGNVSLFANFQPNVINRFLINTSGDTYGITQTAVYKIILNGAMSLYAGGGSTFASLTDIAEYNNESGAFFASDSTKHRIFKINSTGIVANFAGSGVLGYADGNGSSAQFAAPAGIAFDPSGNLFVADEFRVRKINSAGEVSTFAGSPSYADVDGTGTAARFGNLEAIAIDATGNIFVADNRYKKIRKITPAGVVTTLAGSGSAGYADGIGTVARFNSIGGMAIDKAGNIFVSDRDLLTPVYRIRMVNKLGVVSTLLTGNSNTSATNGPLATATVSIPYGLTVDANGNLYISNTGPKTINKVTFQ